MDAGFALVKGRKKYVALFFDEKGDQIRIDKSAVFNDPLGNVFIREENAPFAIVNFVKHPLLRTVELKSLGIKKGANARNTPAFVKILRQMKKTIDSFRKDGFTVKAQTWIFSKYPTIRKNLGFELTGRKGAQKEWFLKIRSEAGKIQGGKKANFPKYAAKRVPK